MGPPSWCDQLDARKIWSDHNNQMLGSVGLRSEFITRMVAITRGVGERQIFNLK